MCGLDARHRDVKQVDRKDDSKFAETIAVGTRAKACEPSRLVESWFFLLY